MAKTEPFPFTADHIGSEVLERFSQDIYKPIAIVRELVKNAFDSYGQLEHFLNDVDFDIEDFECVVKVDIVGDTLVVSDDGLGCDKAGLYDLISIALTGKREIPGVIGFRGIGFWSAYTAGDSIVVESTKLGNDRLFRLTLNTKKMRAKQKPNTSIASIMNDASCVQLTSDKIDKSTHYTKVLISAPSNDGRLHDQVHDPTMLHDLLLEGCSCRLTDETRHGEHIEEFYTSHGVHPATLMYQGDEITKDVPASVGNFNTQSLDIVIGKKKETVAWLWYATNKSNAGLKSPLAGMRLFYEGFPIGRPNTYSEKKLVDSEVEVTRPDLLNWHFGEIHLCHKDLKPDAAGEGLRDSPLFGAFRERLRQFYAELISLSRAKQIRGSLGKKYTKWESKLAALALQATRGDKLTEGDKAELKEIAQTISQENKSARSRSKDAASPTSKANILRGDDVKKKRQKLTGLLKQLQKAGIGLGVNSTVSKKKAAMKKGGGNTNSNGSVGIPRAHVLAMMDDIRDAIEDVLADEPDLQEELLSRVNDIVGKS